MMDGTDRHCRYFHRLLSKHARLYTEMVTAEAILHGDKDQLLGFDAVEHPLALQLGGSAPNRLALAAKIGEDFGYQEINLNVGCPSDRVQSGAFGACLMKTPDLVADCISAMREAVRIPVTVKCRLGVDDQDPSETFFSFVDTVVDAGAEIFIVHARKAWLQGLSPKENRTVPPLDYDIVRALKETRPTLTVVLNGGLTNLTEAKAEGAVLDGVMLGRAAYGEPYILAEVDRAFYGSTIDAVSREATVLEMSDYIKRHMPLGVRPHNVTRHMLGLYHGAPGARRWRRYISENAKFNDGNILDRALEAIALEVNAA